MTYQEFKVLPIAEHDLFICKLLHAIHNNKSCYIYATLPMHVSREDMPYEKFIHLPKAEHDELISNMLNNIHKHETDFVYADDIVFAAEKTNLFDNVIFGEIPEMIGSKQLS